MKVIKKSFPYRSSYSLIHKYTKKKNRMCSFLIDSKDHAGENYTAFLFPNQECHWHILDEGIWKRGEAVGVYCLVKGYHSNVEHAAVYYKWLIESSPMRGVYMPTTVEKVLRGGVALNTSDYSAAKVYCAAIATRFPQENPNRLRFMVEWYNEFNVSFTACWILASQMNEQDLNTFSPDEPMLRRGSGFHDVLSGGSCIKSLSGFVRDGFTKLPSYDKDVSYKAGKYIQRSENMVLNTLGFQVYGDDTWGVWNIVRKYTTDTCTGIGWQAVHRTTMSKQQLEACLNHIQSILDT